MAQKELNQAPEFDKKWFSNVIDLGQADLIGGAYLDDADRSGIYSREMDLTGAHLVNLGDANLCSAHLEDRD